MGHSVEKKFLESRYNNSYQQGADGLNRREARGQASFDKKDTIY